MEVLTAASARDGGRGTSVATVSSGRSSEVEGKPEESTLDLWPDERRWEFNELYGEFGDPGGGASASPRLHGGPKGRVEEFAGAIDTGDPAAG